ncbi:glycerol-3-phosphate 1-O-acyltransferase PlsY [Hylemonella gracilis]|jgi:glycerol-3-phosphate acyltransferase PlsY|uniref:Glycerol-3-phosphate acyltransferase n=1 Tax=Hylemonella gracilis TaxID=80880 RepID=A0A4P6UMR7_9BURK|nr:glycerol-3-phosphate 1-O-acyltransferase PlsY [Hylemonella gracilis]
MRHILATYSSYLLPSLVALASYLLGSLSFAVIVSRVMGLNDPRTYGSKNPGATNVLRSGSKKAAVVTLLLDGAKGWLPVALVASFGPSYGLGEGTLALAALGAFLGHLYPVFFRFVGGKGVATAAGVLLGLHWALGLAVLLTWVLVAVLSRYSSLSALLASVAAPLYYMLGDGEFWTLNPSVLFAVCLMSLLLIYRHAENIGRLARGQEGKLGQKKK